MKLLTRLFTVCLLLLAFTLHAKNRNPIIEKLPAWVASSPVNYSDYSLDEDAEDGYADLHYEIQVSLLQQATYTRKAVRVLSEAGVENLSQVSIDFDPSYQQLIFHTVQIIRNGTIINQLNGSKLKTIQQEKELDRSIYNGSLTSFLVLEDLRKDDIVEYSYTIKGFNPIFKNKYSSSFLLQFDVPVYAIQYRIVVPKGRNLTIKNSSSAVQPQVTSTPAETVYEWKINKALPLNVEKNIPSWYDPYPTLMVSEFNSWKEVNDWALELFVPTTPSAGMLAKINELKTQYKTNEERVVAALQFVQDDVRYLGFEMGVNSHKPHPPAVVFQQRFGDCKDKAYLLCQLLNGLGIQANPVMINTNYKKTINSWLPAPTVFDHVTVCVVLAGKTYWFDPTISYQRGSIDAISFPNYQTGLVIRPGTTGLTAIPLQNKGKIATKESFYVTSLYNPVRMVVATSFTGSFADNVRYEFESNSKREMLKTYQKLYAIYFRKIDADSLSYEDDKTTGVFTTKEYYTIRDFWKDENGKQKVSLEPFLINSIIRTPEDKDRKTPFALAYPATYDEDIEIHLPEEWPIEEGKFDFGNEAFLLNYSYSQPQPNLIKLRYRYENKNDHLQANGVRNYLDELEDANKTIAFELQGDVRVASLSKTMDPEKTSGNIFRTLYVLLGICALGTYFYKRNQRNNY